MSGWVTVVQAVVTALVLVGLGAREWVSVRRGPAAVARRWDVLLALAVAAFAGLMALRLSSGA